MTRYVLSLDQGTTSSRAMLFDRRADVVAVARQEFAQHFPQSGWVEHDANDIWKSQEAAITAVMTAARATAADLAAIGITNQRETTVLWDRVTGEPVSRAIVWQDRRTANVCKELRVRGHESNVAQRTGLLLDPYFSATKLAWLLERTADGRSRAARGELAFGTVDSWLVHHLTGGRAHVTDRSNASRTLLLNIASGDWDQSMLDLFDVPRGCLPTLLPSSIPPSLAPLARIDGCDVPITGIAGDQQAALFGQLCFQPGMAKNTYGTGCFALMNMGGRPLTSRHRLLTTIAWDRVERCYAIEGSVFIGGAVVQWLRDGLGLIEASSEIEPLAATVADAGGVVLVPAFTGLGAPHWDPHARGAIVGLSRGTTRGHLARAALESIAFQCAELLQAMQQAAARPVTELRVDGGASVNNLLMQFQADLLGLPIVRPRVTETTALGAAYLAGLAVGFWSSTEELSRHWQVERVFEPQLSRDNATFLMNRWARAVQRARAWNES